MMTSDLELRITEIFYSLQGEAHTVGRPTAFVRLTGCPLRCHYCDSEYAFYGGEKMLVSTVLERVREMGARYVCVTGGEPLAQPNCALLLSRLCDAGLNVSLETSGAMPIEGLDERVSIVMDLKTPSSGEASKNRYENIEFLKARDQVKFVIGSREDYEWSCFKMDQYRLAERVGDVLFSPIYGDLKAKELAEWIIKDNRNVRFQIQLHKHLWGDVAGV